MLKNQFAFIMFSNLQGQLESLREFSSLTVTLFPLLYFFNFLFYTDPTANALILGIHLLWLQESHGYSALTG